MSQATYEEHLASALLDLFTWDGDPRQEPRGAVLHRRSRLVFPGFKTVLSWGFDVVAPRDGTYKFSAGGLETEHAAQFTAGYKTGKTVVFNATGGTV